MDKDTITISVKDYRNNNQKKTVTMKAVEFIRRFLMHILPKGLVKIRPKVSRLRSLTINQIEMNTFLKSLFSGEGETVSKTIKFTTK
jgi:hypothetical protein